jgi:hypothetical protein
MMLRGFVKKKKHGLRFFIDVVKLQYLVVYLLQLL